MTIRKKCIYAARIYIFYKDTNKNDQNVNSKFVCMCETYFVVIRTRFCLQREKRASNKNKQ